MNKVLADILDRPVPNGLTIPKVQSLIKDVAILDTNPKLIYSSSGEKIIKELDKYGAKDIPQNYRGVLLEHWLEILSQNQETVTEVPQYDQVDSTIPDVERLKQFGEEAEKRVQQKTNIQTREKQTIEDYIKQNEKRIAKAQAVQDKLKDKVVYAKVVIPEPLPLNEIEKQDLSTLREYAQGNEETKQKLIDDLSKQIETKLENIPDEQKSLVARTAAVEIVAKLANPEKAYGEQIQTSILAAVRDDKTEILPTVLQKDDELLIAAKNGSTLLELGNRELTTKTIARNIFGPKLTLAIYGPEQFEVILSETKNEGQTTHEVNLGDLNRGYVEQLEHQNSVLSSVKEFGIDRTQSYFTSQARTYIAEKMAGLPAGSVIKKAYSDPIIQSIFARYGLANPVVWETAAGQSSQFVGLLMRVSPDTAGPILGFAGRMTGIEFVTPITTLGGGAVGATIAAQAATTYTSIAISGGVMAAEAFAGGAGGAAAGAAAGSVVPGVGTVIGAVVGIIGGEVIKPIISKLKTLWTENKDKIGPGLAIGATVGGLMVFGPTGGIVAGGLTLAATGGLAAFATGAFNLFGFIGRSVGIAIATPVIITLLVLPPLVAFIMLVINNSAYVVPPGLSSSSSGADNPYMLVTKEATPTKLDNSSSPQTVIYLVTVKALKNNLTNLKIVGSECNVIKKDKSKVNCPTEVFPDIDPSQGVSPTQAYAFTFTGIYDGKYNDSLIYDSITFSAEVDGQTITTSGSASVCIGDCPANCAVVSDIAGKWPPNYRSNSETALGKLSGYQGFTAKLCPRNETVNLCYKPSEIDPGYYAWHAHNTNRDGCDVYFNEKGVSNDRDALFLITHELTHHIQKINGGETAKYLVSGGWIPELVGKGFCTYKDTAGSYTESMAEAAGLYTSIPSWGSCASNYKNMYPRNYSWAQGFMEK